MDMYSASIPVFERMLASMQAWLGQARAYAQSRGFDESVYLGLRLAPDMLPLSRQVQIASDAAKAGVARLAGETPPSWPDEEATLDELLLRLQRTREFIASVPAAALVGSEARELRVPRRQGEALQFKGEDFLRFYALPNFYFHATTLYALLRHAGVPLGKQDYLGAR